MDYRRQLLDDSHRLFISFLTAWKLFLQLQTYRIPAAVALFLSVSRFWSSGLIKESLGLASIYVLVSLFLTWYRRGHVVWYNYILGVVAVWVGWNLNITGWEYWRRF